MQPSALALCGIYPRLATGHDLSKDGTGFNRQGPRYLIRCVILDREY